MTYLISKRGPILTLQDFNITVDLRINNGFKGTSFDIFWEEVESYFNEVI